MKAIENRKTIEHRNTTENPNTVWTLIRKAGSMKLTIALLVAILIEMAAGTILESAHGAAQAQRYVYGALWFRGLLALFALNVACSVVARWPWGGREPASCSRMGRCS